VKEGGGGGAGRGRVQAHPTQDTPIITTHTEGVEGEAGTAHVDEMPAKRNDQEEELHGRRAPLHHHHQPLTLLILLLLLLLLLLTLLDMSSSLE